MARSCEVCGKSIIYGRSIVRHGLSKKKGGIGLHTTGISSRVFLPNLHKIRVRINGGVKRMSVCARCIKSGKVQKA